MTRAVLYALVCSLLCHACSEFRHELFPTATDASSDSARDLDANVAEPAPNAPRDASAIAAREDAALARCGKRACACDNGEDDDRDGLVDGLDPECTGAFDDDERSFATGLPNKGGGCRDCFWDDNAGSGDDDCRYPRECLAGMAVNGNGNCSSCDVSSRCVQHCQERTPNGCDCFGCCEIVRGDGEHLFIELDERCQLDNLDDAASCPRCQQNPSCVNPCGRCELCLGKSEADLPADCGRNGDLTYSCDDGPTTCRTSADCEYLRYCHLGCCLVDLQ